MVFQLVLVRHGQSVYNDENKFTGWADVQLTSEGFEEAVQVVAGLALLRAFRSARSESFASWAFCCVLQGHCLLRPAMTRSYFTNASNACIQICDVRSRVLGTIACVYELL